MGAKGSKPHGKEKSTTRKNNKNKSPSKSRNNNKSKRNNTSANLTAIKEPPPPTNIPCGDEYHFSIRNSEGEVIKEFPKRVSCANCPPADPKKKTPRSGVPWNCLEEWELGIPLSSITYPTPTGAEKEPGILCGSHEYASFRDRDPFSGRPLGIYLITGCNACNPPDPEKKNPRRNIPNKCLTKWENRIIIQESKARQATMNATPANGVVLDEPGITWDSLKSHRDKKRVQFFTHNDQEYLCIDTNLISKKTVERGGTHGSGKGVFNIPELYIQYQVNLDAFCNATFPTELIEQQMGEDGYDLYFILRNDKQNNKMIIEAFMTLFIEDDYIEVGSFCVGPKRGGLGRVCINQVKKMVEDQKKEYILLEPARGSDRFYKNSGFYKHPEEHTYLIWCRHGATHHLCKGGDRNANSNKNNNNNNND